MISFDTSHDTCKEHCNDEKHLAHIFGFLELSFYHAVKFVVSKRIEILPEFQEISEFFAVSALEKEKIQLTCYS